MNIDRYFVQLKATKSCKLTYEYQYPLMKLLYQCLENEDTGISQVFHDNGYEIDNKKFKLINTYLLMSDTVFTKDYIQIQPDSTIELMLSGDQKYINLVIKGLIKMENINLCNCNFQITSMKQDQNIKFKKQMLYKVLSQVVESTYNNKIEYLNPYQQQFYSALAQNLKRKYQLVYNEEYQDELFFDIENILSVKKKKIQNIKGNGYKVGYGNFNIWIEASPKMQKIAYYTGLGQANFLGAGTLIYLTSN